VPWEIFERVASRYEDWYTTPRGERADQAERVLLEWLLGLFPGARSVLEVGCGTGHFTTWLAKQGLWGLGLDRAPTMLTDLHRREPALPVILSDAHRLPMRGGAVDLVMFVTTLEFLEEPDVALAEAVRVARRGLLLVVLNRWSQGGLSRRWGSQARGSLLGQARDFSLGSLRALVQKAANGRLQKIHWTSTLFPDGLWRVQVPLPVGDVIGMAVVCTTPSPPRPSMSALKERE
jgi:SAM-dependent methyltransferase